MPNIGRLYDSLMNMAAKTATWITEKKKVKFLQKRW
jgi:hypothetical protein